MGGLQEGRHGGKTAGLHLFSLRGRSSSFFSAETQFQAFSHQSDTDTFVYPASLSTAQIAVINADMSPFPPLDPTTLCLIMVLLISPLHIQNLHHLRLIAFSHSQVISVDSSLPSLLPSSLPPFLPSSS